MYKKLIIAVFLFLVNFSIQSQSIGILGAATVTGWVSGTSMNSTDNIFYTLSNQVLTANEAKFRQDEMWTTNWGGTTFPTGSGVLNGINIGISPAGTYNIFFNRLSGGYSFLLSNTFPKIGIWGPAVTPQQGYGAPDVEFSTSDGVNYLLSAFYYSGGSGYFRQDKCSGLTFGSTAFPSGIAVPSGPTLQITGGLLSCRYNRISGAYSFSLPSIGILGTALNGYGAPDVNLDTTDGFTYSLNNLVLNSGTIKFRMDDEWISNWGGTTFQTGTGVADGSNISVTPGTYNVTFNRSTLQYSFTNTLSNETFYKSKFKINPNPTTSDWNISSLNTIDSVQLFDILGKEILTLTPKNDNVIIDASSLKSGIYFAKISISTTSETIKLIKK